MPIYQHAAPAGPDQGHLEGTLKRGPSHFETHNAAFSVSVPRFDVRKRLHEIAAPTLVVVGLYDPVCPLSAAEEISGSIPNSKLVIFEKSGHHPPKEEPEKFQAVVSEFLSNLGNEQI